MTQSYFPDLRVCQVHENHAILATILFISLSMCAMKFAEKLTTFHFCLKLHELKTTDHTLKILTVAKVKLLAWKYMS